MSIDISAPLADLCALLGIEKTNVKRLELNPGHVTAIMFKTTDAGSKYIDFDSDQPALEQRMWSVNT